MNLLNEWKYGGKQDENGDEDKLQFITPFGSHHRYVEYRTNNEMKLPLQIRTINNFRKILCNNVYIFYLNCNHIRMHCIYHIQNYRSSFGEEISKSDSLEWYDTSCNIVMIHVDVQSWAFTIQKHKMTTGVNIGGRTLYFLC